MVKRKLDLLIRSKGDLHRSNKVKFSNPRVQTRFAFARLQLQPILEVTSPLLQIAHIQETNCILHEEHIVRILHKAKNKC